MNSCSLPEAKELGKLLAGNYVQRRDTKARQYSKGYAPVTVSKDDTTRIPFGLSDFVEHVQGVNTFGHYLVDEDNKCRMFAFDIDLAKTAKFLNRETDAEEIINPREVWLGETSNVKHDLAMQLKAMANGLAIRTHRLLECKVTVHYSGSKGMHVIGCLDPGTPAAEARLMAVGVLESFDDVFEVLRGKNFWHVTNDMYCALEIEVFPKQDEVRSGDGLGNLLRLPLGKNLKTGHDSFFLDLTCPWTVIQADDPIKALTLGSVRA